MTVFVTILAGNLAEKKKKKQNDLEYWWQSAIVNIWVDNSGFYTILTDYLVYGCLQAVGSEAFDRCQISFEAFNVV